MTRSAPKHRTRAMAPRHVPASAEPAYGQGRGGRPWRRKRAAVMKRDCYLCQTCKRAGRVAAATEVDHVLPRAAGGTDDYDNLEAICGDCHAVKTKAEAARARHPRGPSRT